MKKRFLIFLVIMAIFMGLDKLTAFAEYDVSQSTKLDTTDVAQKNEKNSDDYVMFFIVLMFLIPAILSGADN